jgi:hypothetical protein
VGRNIIGGEKMGKWYNPSRTARLWDPRNNRHIEPQETTTVEPTKHLLKSFKMLAIDEAPKQEQSTEPIVLSSALQLESEPETAESESE